MLFFLFCTLFASRKSCSASAPFHLGWLLVRGFFFHTDTTIPYNRSRLIYASVLIIAFTCAFIISVLSTKQKLIWESQTPWQELFSLRRETNQLSEAMVLPVWREAVKYQRVAQRWPRPNPTSPSRPARDFPTALVPDRRLPERKSRLPFFFSDILLDYTTRHRADTYKTQ